MPVARARKPAGKTMPLPSSILRCRSTVLILPAGRLEAIAVIPARAGRLRADGRVGAGTHPGRERAGDLNSSEIVIPASTQSLQRMPAVPGSVRSALVETFGTGLCSVRAGQCVVRSGE